MRVWVLLWLVALPVFELGCAKSGGNAGKGAPKASTDTERASDSEGPIRVETLAEATPPIFVLRGGPRGPEKIVFLHGMCGHGLGYAQSFQLSAAKRGTLIAPQADLPCDGGSGARWSRDVPALDRRITSAFHALGHAEPILDVIAIGYSQGATRVEALAREYPERYTRLVLMGGPSAAKSRGLETLRAAVAMAGDRDRLDLMKASARTLAAAGVPATFLLIPDAPHGSMGSRPEETMEEVFTWIAENQREE